MTSVGLNLLLRRLAELDPVGAVDLLADDLNLLLDRLFEVIQELELRVAFAHRHECLRKGLGACTTLGPVVTDDRGIGTAAESELTDELKLGLGVRAVPDTSAGRSTCGLWR